MKFLFILACVHAETCSHNLLPGASPSVYMPPCYKLSQPASKTSSLNVFVNFMGSIAITPSHLISHRGDAVTGVSTSSRVPNFEFMPAHLQKRIQYNIIIGDEVAKSTHRFLYFDEKNGWGRRRKCMNTSHWTHDTQKPQML